MSEIGIATTGMITPRTEPRKRKMTRMTMISVSVERLEHLVDRVLDVRRGVVRHAALHAGRQLRLNLRHRFANALHHVERVRGRQHVDADEDGGLAVEADFLVVRLGAEDDVGDVAEAHDRAVLIPSRRAA